MLGIRVDGRDGIRKAGQAIYAGNQDIVNAAVFEIGQHREPEIGTLALGQVEAENLFLAFRLTARTVYTALLL